MIIKNGKTISSIYKDNKIIEKIYKGTLVVYESWKDLFASGVPPLTLTNCKGVDLVDYKIYGDSIQEGEPTPDIPFEIESVGEKTINLFKLPKDSSVNVNLLQNGLESLASGRCSISIDNIPFEVGKKYTVKIDYENVNEFGSSGTFRLSNGSTSTIIGTYNTPVRVFEATEDFLEYNQIWIYGENTRYLNIMIVEGEYTSDTFPEYEPYGKYKIPVRVRGKNLIDYKKAYSTYGTLSFIDNGFEYVGKWMVNIPVSLEIGKYYTFSSDITGYLEGSTYPYWVIHYTDDTYSTATKLGYAQLCGKEADRISLYVSNATEVMSVITNIQLEEGKTATEYEPYYEPIITNIYLDELLRKIGDYTDYVDFKSKKVIRNIAEKKLVNTSITLKSTSSTEGFNYYFVPLTDAMAGRTIPILSNIGGGTLNDFQKKDKEGIFSNINNTYFLAFFDITTLAEARQFVTDNEVYVNYILTTPTEELIELPNIPTHKGTTILEVDTTIQPSNMEVIYKGKR